MLDTIVNQITAEVKRNLPDLVSRLNEDLSFGDFERSLSRLMQDIVGVVVSPVLNGVLQDEGLLLRLREAAGCMGYRYKEHRWITVRVLEGVEVRVYSPYFIKKAPKRGRKKSGPCLRQAGQWSGVSSVSGRAGVYRSEQS